MSSDPLGGSETASSARTARVTEAQTQAHREAITHGLTALAPFAGRLIHGIMLHSLLDAGPIKMSERDELLFQYIGRGGAHCPICSYALDGLQEPRCPECGEPLVLAVRGESMRRNAWIAGLVAWSAGFGLYGLFIPLTMLLRSGPPIRYWAFYAGIVICWPGIVVWLLIARKFRLWSPRTRLVLAASSIAIIALLLLVTGLQLR